MLRAMSINNKLLRHNYAYTHPKTFSSASDVLSPAEACAAYCVFNHIWAAFELIKPMTRQWLVLQSGVCVNEKESEHVRKEQEEDMREKELHQPLRLSVAVSKELCAIFPAQPDSGNHLSCPQESFIMLQGGEAGQRQTTTQIGRRVNRLTDGQIDRQSFQFLRSLFFRPH